MTKRPSKSAQQRARRTLHQRDYLLDPASGSSTPPDLTPAERKQRAAEITAQSQADYEAAKQTETPPTPKQQRAAERDQRTRARLRAEGKDL